MKRIIVILLVLLCVGCQSKPKDIKEVYPEIINESVFVEAKQDDIIAMLKNGTGVVFFSWSECPWCHDYINYVNESARLNDLEVLFYDMYEERKKDSDFYKEVCELISDSIDEYAYSTNGEVKKGYDSNGKVRIYMPMVIYTDRGNIIGMDYSGSMEEDHDKNADNYWNEIIDGSKRTDIIISNLETWSKEISEIKKEIDSQGCDDACEIKED